MYTKSDINERIRGRENIERYFLYIIHTDFNCVHVQYI